MLGTVVPQRILCTPGDCHASKVGNYVFHPSIELIHAKGGPDRSLPLRPGEYLLCSTVLARSAS